MKDAPMTILTGGTFGYTLNSAGDALLYYTRCQIVTYSMVCERKASSLADKRRHRSICEGMLAACQRFCVDQAAVAALFKRLREVA